MKLLKKVKEKQPKPRRIYKPVSKKTVNVYTSSVMPKMQTINPLYGLVINRGFALSKRSNDKLGTPLKKSNGMLLIVVFLVIGLVAGIVVYMMLSGSGPNASGEGGLPGPLGPLSKLGESFNIPSLSNNKG